MKCWGFNVTGQLGAGPIAGSSTPVDVVGIVGATGISNGTYHSSALISGGSLECWGSNGDGRAG